jgi:glutamate synthase domain-containing protein 2
VTPRGGAPLLAALPRAGVVAAAVARRWRRDTHRDVPVKSGAMPDFVEHWSRTAFRNVGLGLLAASGGLCAAWPVAGVPALGLTALYWYIGITDIRQEQHAIRRNFPVLGNVRYLLESVRPEIRQYLVESDADAAPFSRTDRTLVYRRAKKLDDTTAFGTRHDVYGVGYKFVAHALFPKHVPEDQRRVTIGGDLCKHPYSASLLNISAMSYGALSENAILALNTAAKRGNFYHNTGEGGISRFHLQPGGDIVWNVGTGYFGCGQGGKQRTFDPALFQANATRPEVKMIELKLSQGAKPSHGGLLPKAKVTRAIAEARGLPFPAVEDCNSPPAHSAFSTPRGLCEFLQRLRELSGGKPVGMKMCVGQPEDVSAVIHAMLQTGIFPDFITVDGGEGGTGAAPSEFVNGVGMPMKEGLALVHALLVGADIRHKVKLIAAGKVVSGLAIIETLAYGADLCNSARGMMFALGCIQALKCNTNKCPTGVTSQEPALMEGLVVPDKATRVFEFQAKTVETAFELMGAMGLTRPAQVDPRHFLQRIGPNQIRTLGEIYPHLEIKPGALLRKDSGLDRLQTAFDLDDGVVQYSYVS